MTVQKLPEDIIRGIAAGEVVDRPASVLKELLENALDAGGRHIEIEWRDAGRTRLSITDDGLGMTPADARLAMERHATSKITSLDDLECLTTYGFRGEALPSISAVSKFRLETRPPGAAEGWSLRWEAGRLMEEKPTGAPVGTRVVVDELFFGVPARLKFLKSDATERGHLMRVVEDVALAEPTVAFRIRSEDKPPLVLPALADPNMDFLERLALLWGDDKTAGWRPVRAEGSPLSVTGWVSGAQQSLSSARYQRFFVNRRPVTNRRLLHALYDGYRGQLFVGRHPAAVLFLDLDPSLVDVNVHPTKREVRFSKEEQVHDFVSRAVRSTLAANAGSSPGALTTRDVPALSMDRGTSRPPVSFRAGAPTLPPNVAEAREAFALQQPLWTPPPADNAPLPREEFRSIRFEPLGQTHNTYLLARGLANFFVFDQHAAAERAMYERLTRDRATRARQGLLIPWVWDPSAEAAAMLIDELPRFVELGFDLEPFGASSFRVTAVPAALGDGARVREVLEGLAEDLVTGRVPRDQEAITVRAACRGSVMAGQALTSPETTRLIADLQACDSPWTCPHGRPTFLILSAEDLAKRFRRI